MKQLSISAFANDQIYKTLRLFIVSLLYVIAKAARGRAGRRVQRTPFGEAISFSRPFFGVLPFSTTKIAIVPALLFTSFHVYAQDPQSLMNTGNNAYNEGLYDSALVCYSRIVDKQMESAALYYNMGNAYFKNNDLAPAILFYEKAKKLAPNDEDIAYNLGITNSMIVDRIERVPVLFYQHWWNYFYNLFDANTWTVISIIIWLVLLVFIGIFVLTQSRSTKKLSFYTGLLFLLLSIGTFGLASQKYYYSREHKEAIIFTPTITVKSSPTPNAVDLFVVHEGTKIRIMDQVQNWVKIKIPDGSVGWLPEESLRTI